MKGILSILLLGFSLLAEGQKIYYQSFGDKKDPTILFLHGGPGYNSASFEATSAQNLANAGYHVIVYDRRRSEERRVGKECRSRWSPYH